MKSKRAKEYLSNTLFDGDTRLTEHIHSDLSKAVELAEDDARERAVKAMCTATEDGGYRCEDVCPRRHDRYCSYVRDFIEAYDNEQ